ncbi:hypothetical protein [Magnetofaba australis]|uniref:hypothetical protein n=1 Tax=Magnetofaba australis TaxID=1472297 RepID=UPI000A19F16D|nr:hypothetical protein [Magnetofaba australis]
MKRSNPRQGSLFEGPQLGLFDFRSDQMNMFRGVQHAFGAADLPRDPQDAASAFRAKHGKIQAALLALKNAKRCQEPEDESWWRNVAGYLSDS